MGYVPPKLIKVPDGCNRAEIGLIYLSGLKSVTHSKKMIKRIDGLMARLQDGLIK